MGSDRDLESRRGVLLKPSNRRRRTLAAVAGFCGLVLATAPAALGAFTIPGPPVLPPSSAPPAPLGTLDPSHPVLTFAGPDLNPTPIPQVNSPVPVVCVQPLCQEYQVTIPRSEPFLVAVKGTVTGANGAFNPNDGFDLYVYDPSGNLAGAANGIGANGQSLEFHDPSAGTYTVVVTYSYLEDQDASYVGEVRLMQGNSWKPAPCVDTTVGGLSGCFNLPRLQVVPPYDLAVAGVPPVASTPLGFPLPSPVAMPTSCYLDETVPLDNLTVGSLQQPATRCLRFTSDVRNVGGGTLQIRIPLVSSGSSGPGLAYLPGQCSAEQVVDTTDNQEATRPAGACLFHTEHLHFHYSDLLAYSLYGLAPGGGIGSKVGSSVKASFCLSDDDYFGYGTTGPNSQRDFSGQPGCNVPVSSSSGAPFIDEGIKPGWGDVYTWDTPGQYIDVTNTQPGTYDLVEETNPTGALLVDGPAQTCALTQLRLDASSVTILSRSQLASCPA